MDTDFTISVNSVSVLLLKV